MDPLIAQFFDGQLETRRGEKPAVFMLSQAADQQMALSKALPIHFHKGSRITVDAFTKYRNHGDSTVYVQIMDTDDLIYCTGLNAEFRLARSLRGTAVECRSWTAGRVYSRLFCNQFWPKKDENLRRMMESDESIRDEADRPFLMMDPATTVCFQEGVPDSVPDREDVLFPMNRKKFNPNSERFQQMNSIGPFVAQEDSVFNQYVNFLAPASLSIGLMIMLLRDIRKTHQKVILEPLYTEVAISVRRATAVPLYFSMMPLQYYQMVVPDVIREWKERYCEEAKAMAQELSKKTIQELSVSDEFR
ncbi:MAG: hypothetical protein GY795_51380, partial [Desulfobacterales bacterium]|nr:hypothetical protein [Desulfobacterales bacterium]